MSEYKFYMAPLEGVTTHIYRRLHHKYFQPMDLYFTPFLVPHEKKGFAHRELMDICPEHNEGLPVIPQILDKHVDGFLSTAKKLADFGYTEVNLNLGCPSKTVVSKGRGSGFLSDLEGLEEFLDGIFEKCPMEISIKTRIGRFGPDEFAELLQLYNKYPVKELIIHPRVQTDYYKNTPNLEVYAYAMKESKIPLCYNGDIVDIASFDKIKTMFPENTTFMLGRGLMADPFLAEHLHTYLETGEIHSPATQTKEQREKLYAFLTEVMEAYYATYENETGTLYKMKELWGFMKTWYPAEKKAIKQIIKSNTMKKYSAAVEAVLLK